MFKKLENTIINGKLFCAVEHSNAQQKNQFIYLLLKKKKKELVVEKNGICFEFDDLTKLIKKNQHLFLIINNEQVLTKIVDGKLDKQKALQTAFPNLNFDDFYYESYCNQSSTFISICRKKYVDEIIKQYEKSEINVIDFSLGNLAGTQLLPFFNESNLQTSNSSLVIKNQEIQEIQKTKDKIQKEYNINDLEINNNFVLGLGGILSYYTGQITTQKSFADKVNELHKRFTQIRVFDLGLKTGLGFVFILLLVNFLIYSNFRDKINILKSEIEVNESYKGSLLSLKQEVNKKKKIVDEITSSETSRVSLYLDKIGASVPSSVLLNSINYQPLLRDIKKDKEIQYLHQQILVKGLSTNGDAFSKWVSFLEQKKWIQSITLVNYGTGKKLTTEFKIKITLRQ